MKATSLSVNLWAPCNAKCPFCISRLTWKTGEHSNDRLLAALPKAFRYAKWHGVDTVLVTSNGEPTLARGENPNHPVVISIIEAAQRAGFPIIEMQTNGEPLTREPMSMFLGDFLRDNLTTLAISVADMDPARSAEVMSLPDGFDYLELARKASDKGILVRISLNLTRDVISTAGRWTEYAHVLRDAGVHQLTVRILGQPAGAGEDHPVVRWIDAHGPLPEQARNFTDLLNTQGVPLRRLSYGNVVYAFEDLAVTGATCMSDNADPDEIRSLILMPDGHLYHSWNYRGSILL